MRGSYTVALMLGLAGSLLVLVWWNSLPDITDRGTSFPSGKRAHRKTANRGLNPIQLVDAGKNTTKVNTKQTKTFVEETYSRYPEQNKKSRPKMIFNENHNINLTAFHNETVERSKGTTIHSTGGSRKNQTYDGHSKDREQISRDKYGSRLKCPDVLGLMLQGRWEPRRVTEEEQAEMRQYYLETRKLKGMPLNLEREDKLCGNVTFLHPNDKWRALCDPDGPTPCCYKTACVSKPIEECACAGCYDMRTHIHAEFSTWRPADARCQPQTMSAEEACNVLNGSTVYFMGDSLLRHFYTAFLMAARADQQNGAFAPNTSKGVRDKCGGKNLFPSNTPCTRWLDYSASLCNGTASAAFFNHKAYTNTTTADILQQVSRLRNTPKSLVVLGVGLWYQLDPRKVKKRILLPVLRYLSSPGGSQSHGPHLSSPGGSQSHGPRLTMSGSFNLSLPVNSSKWKADSRDSPDHWNFTSNDSAGPRNPRVLWANTHAPGILKSPIIHKQKFPRVVAYNEDMRKLLQAWNVPEFDTVNMTSQGVTSLDGTHYGLGVNVMKATVLLNYLSLLQDRQQW